MQIRFDEIPPTGLVLTLEDPSWFPAADELKHHGPVRATVSLEREGEKVMMAGTLEATVLLPCDRCLEPCSLSLTSAFRVQLEVADPGGAAVVAAEAEHLCRFDEMDTIELDRPLVELDEILAQQLYLALPLKRLCRESCRGLCPVCGADLNRKNHCGCRPAEGDSPFAALRRLELK